MQCVGWMSDSQMIVTGSVTGSLTKWDVSTTEPEWVSVVATPTDAVTFSPGQLLYGEENVLEKHFIYVVEMNDGTIRTLKPSEFRQEFAPPSN